MFHCNTCSKDYDNDLLARYSYYISKRDGSITHISTCVYCAAAQDNRYYDQSIENKEWSELSDKYPRIFNKYDGEDVLGREVYRPAHVAGGVGLGWYKIISDACELIQIELDTMGSHAFLQFMQMKEKFGGLRWYTTTPVKNKWLNRLVHAFNKNLFVDPRSNTVWTKVVRKFKLWKYRLPYPNNPIQKIIDAAEEESYKTCEVCGLPGTLHRGSWIQTLCNGHADGLEIYKEEDNDI